MRGNKRGQEGFSFGAVLGLVVGVVALVMVALFVYNIFGKAGTTLELLPGEEASASQMCSLVAGSGEANLVCDDFKELKVSGKKRLVSCYYVKSLFSKEPEWADKIKTIDCENAPYKKCALLKQAGGLGKNGVLVNGGVCVGSSGNVKGIEGTFSEGCFCEESGCKKLDETNNVVACLDIPPSL